MDTNVNSTAVGIALQARGWTPSPGPFGALVGAHKAVCAAVGQRVAQVWMRRSADGSASVLEGRYESEGINALCCCSQFIADGVDERRLDALVDRFTENVERAIAGTYAVRLAAA